MLNSIYTATLIAKSLSNLVSADRKNSYQELERVAQARRKYQQQKTELGGDPIEEFRNTCLSKICDLQHELILEVSDEVFLQKILPLLLGHIGNLYEADTQRELTIIDMSLARIEHAINNYKEEKKRRKRIRMYAVLVSLGCVFLLGVFLWAGSVYGKIDHNFKINILNIPVPVLLWSIIGSFSAILYRFTNAGDRELNEPLRWLFARPLTGIIMGVISYLVIKVGLVTIQGHQEGTGIVNPEVIWLIAFLAGFSDRFSESLLRTVVGKFGGDKDGELVSTEVRAQSTKVSSATHPVLDELDIPVEPDKDPAAAPTPAEVQADLLTDKADVNLKPAPGAAPVTQTSTIETNEIAVTQINNVPAKKAE